MSLVRQKLMSLLPALLALVLVIVLHASAAQPLAAEAMGYPAVHAASQQQPNPASATLGQSHCSADHACKTYSFASLSRQTTAGAAIWSGADRFLGLWALLPPPHRPPITI